MAAAIAQKNPIEFVGGILEHGHDLQSCLGTDHERDIAFQEIQNSRKNGVVLDAYSVWTAATINVLDIIEALLGPIFIPQSVRDDLLIFRGFEDFQRSDSMSLVHRGGQFYRTENDRESIDARNTYVSQQIEKIEITCSVSPVVAPNQLSPLEDTVLENCNEHVLDAIFLCAEDHLLISEDLRYRQFAAETASVKSLWLHAIILFARDQGIISEDRYTEAVVNLASLKHSPLAIDARLLRSALARDSSRDLLSFNVVARCIGNANADYISHAGVVREFIDATYADRALDRLVRQRAVSAVLRNLIRLSSDEAWPFIIAMVIDNLNSDDRSYVYGWVKGHFLNPKTLHEVEKQLKAGRRQDKSDQRLGKN